jgi:phage antirepressor YoqD-like protein
MDRNGLPSKMKNRLYKIKTTVITTEKGVFMSITTKQTGLNHRPILKPFLMIETYAT